MFRLAIDIGGTFTDLFAYNVESGDVFSYKLPSTPSNPEVGVIQAVKEFLFESKAEPSDIQLILHATTIAANTLIGQLGLKLPKVALITTRGFKDVIEIGRQNRPKLYDLFFEKPRPLVGAEDRYEVAERILWNGVVEKSLNENEVRELLGAMCFKNYDSVAVSLLHSYANPLHEKKIADVFREKEEAPPTTLSSEVLPEIREYERTSTTVINAILIPLVASYIAKLECELEKLSVKPNIQLFQSNGGLIDVVNAKKLPAKIIESGPAAGAIAARFYGELTGENNVISFDMGGTTAKAGLICNGQMQTTHDYEVGGLVHTGRIVKGSGYPVRFSFLDLSEVGTGGGSIASVDSGGLLRVGPLSAGAIPGPACYGLGFTEPTVTDAHLILRRLNPQYFLGGKMMVYPDLAYKAVDRISKSLGGTVEKCAEMIIRVVNANMIRAMSLISTERGYDPRDFTLVAFGGAGPLHAGDIMDELGIKKCLIPPNPGMTSAMGLLVSDYIYDTMHTHLSILSQTLNKEIDEWYTLLEDEATEALIKAGLPPSHIILLRLMDLRYQGQSYELTVPLASGKVTDKVLSEAIENFHEKHFREYGYRRDDVDVELVNLRVEGLVKGSSPKVVRLLEGRGNGLQALLGEDSVNINGWVKTKMYLREKLLAGDELYGPAIIHQYDSTILIKPEHHAKVHWSGTILVERG